MNDRINAIKMKRRPPKKKKPNLSSPNPVFYRTTDNRYELLARRAEEAGHGSLQRIVDEWNFPRGTEEEELEALRKEQRARGLADSKFWPPRKKKKHGIKVRTGRHPRPEEIVA